jgi:hypothetical protein
MSKNLSLLLFIIGTPALYAGSSQLSSLDCIARMELPRYAVVGTIRATSTVDATILVGAGGKAERVTIKTDHPLSGDEVKYHLAELTTYKEDCRNKEIDLTFRLQFSGRASYSPNVRTFFVAPRTFVIEVDLGKSAPQILPLK